MDIAATDIRGGAARDEAELEHEIGRMSMLARRVAVAEGLRGQDIDEVAQVAVLEFLEGWTDRTKPWPEKLLPIIVKRRAVDQWRAGQQRRRHEQSVAGVHKRESEGAGVGGVSGDVDPIVQEALDRVIARLSEQDRSLLDLRYLRGLTFKQIAAVTGDSEPELRDRMQRIRRALRRRGIG